MVAASAVSQLHADEDFKVAMAGAQRELAALDRAALVPTRDCAGEADALAAGFFR
jgi:hypothetical protein